MYPPPPPQQRARWILSVLLCVSARARAAQLMHMYYKRENFYMYVCVCKLLRQRRQWMYDVFYVGELECIETSNWPHLTPRRYVHLLTKTAARTQATADQTTRARLWELALYRASLFIWRVARTMHWWHIQCRAHTPHTHISIETLKWAYFIFVYFLCFYCMGHIIIYLWTKTALISAIYSVQTFWELFFCNNPYYNPWF